MNLPKFINNSKQADLNHCSDYQHHKFVSSGSNRFPSWSEQKIQFLIRYIFWCLALAFFNFVQDIDPAWLSRTEVNGVLLVYFFCVTGLFLHGQKNHNCRARFRLAMWVDIIIVSFGVLNDPYSLPPTVLVYIVVVLGNGMRYGMKIFGEALLGSFAALMISFSMRFAGSLQEMSPGLFFLNLFGGIILVYSYFLMSRVESSRQKLEQHSRVDHLTDLINRRALFEYADHLFNAIERRKSIMAVMFADLDKFKAINDSYGHAIGDTVLKDFAKILMKNVRGADVAARLGGDEFVLLLPDADIDHAEVVARRIQDEVRNYAKDRGYDFSVTIGLGEVPAHGKSLADLLEQVDRALYLSKFDRERGGIERVQDLSPEEDRLQT